MSKQVPYTISLNGADNVGKTTQIELLPSHYTVSETGGLHENDKNFGEMHRQGLLEDWWWNSTNEEFVRAIFGGLEHRYMDSVAKCDCTVGFCDRGTAMFEAVAAAVIAVRDSIHDLDKARTVFHEMLEKNRLRVPKEDLAILMKHGDSLEQSIRISVSREVDPVNERYQLYQSLLQAELHYQERSGVYQHVLHVETTSGISNVQDKLREVILRYTKNPLFLPLMHRLDRVYALSGLSESGKSSVAEAFCSHRGTVQAFRAKIVHFNSLISERLGRSVYLLPEREQALYLLHKIERFSTAHYWLRLITIESMHRHTVAKWLKVYLGDKLRIIYVGTADARRLERSLLTTEMITSDDELKRERGVELIRSNADLVLDNNRPFADTMCRLLQL